MIYFLPVPTFDDRGKKKCFPIIMNLCKKISEFTCHVEKVTGRTLHFIVSSDISFKIT